MSKGLETQLVRECAPTLAGIKTANLFNYKYSSREEFMQELAEANKQLNVKGLYIEVLRCGDASALIYVYRRSLFCFVDQFDEQIFLHNISIHEDIFILCISVILFQRKNSFLLVQVQCVTVQEIFFCSIYRMIQ